MENKPKGKMATGTAVKPELKNGSFGFVLPQPLLDWQAQQGDNPVIVLRSERLGDDTIPGELGLSLMAAFLRAIAAGPSVPSTLLLYGSAVCLAAPDSQWMDVLRHIQKKGCEILCCRISYTSLVEDDSPPVGRLADWVDLTDRMQKAKKILWP